MEFAAKEFAQALLKIITPGGRWFTNTTVYGGQ